MLVYNFELSLPVVCESEAQNCCFWRIDSLCEELSASGST